MSELSALFDAVNKNDQALAEELLRGAGKQDVNREVNGEYPIHAAAKARNNQLVKLLVENGANVNQAFPQSGSLQGYTALHFAARNGDIDLVELLHKLGADLNRAANDGWRPIHAAAFGGKRPAMLALLDCGADIDGANPHGHTALTYSANYGRASDVRELIRRGAKTSIVDKLGDTMLHHTFHYRMSKLFEGEYDVPDVQLDVAVLLALEGVDAEAKNVDGEVAAHFLIEEEDWPSVNKLLKVIAHNAAKLKASKVEWNYMTFVNAKVEILVGLGLDLKHAIDLVELAASVDRERIAAKKAREEARPAGGCPVMTGKKKKKGKAGAEGEAAASDAAAPSTAKTGHGHGDIDISKMDPNGPDPSGGQCPFFKKSAAATAAAPSTAAAVAAPKPPVGANMPISDASKAIAAAHYPTGAAAASSTPQPQPTAAPKPAARDLLSFLQANQQQVLQLLLAFFFGIWFEQNMQRLFGR